MPYACGFEEDEDLSNWVLNAQTPLAKDKWMYGSVTHSEGKRSLYISTNAQDAQYGTNPNITISYLRYKFPTESKQKNYDISFDWRCEGEENASMLYVMICPEQFFFNKVEGNEGYYIGNIVSSNTGVLSSKVANVCQQLGPTKQRALYGSDKWQNVSFSNDHRVSSRNSQLNWVIVFIWANSNINKDNVKVGGCIDNLQIASATIRKPTNVQVEPHCEDSTLHVTWESASSFFAVEYRLQGSSTWRRADGLTRGVQYFDRVGNNCSYDLQRIKEGSYDVRVKSALGNDTSAYATCNNIVMYCPDNHCINFLDLDNPNLVCTWGWREGYQGHTPYENLGYISIPEDRKMSRHTIMMDANEIDPNTEGGLRCVPKGELGSVRLGNWNTNYEAESMTYTFAVDSFNASILLIKYAIVLQKPGEGCGDPGFKVELFDENDFPITDLCGVPDFTYSKAAAEGWNQTKELSTPVAWKDWTTVGVNVMQYAGQNIKVRFTTYDCGAGGHYGYGYFCLNCASAYIETENCGNDAKIVCEAPEGFAYRWYDKETGVTVGRNKELVADAGMHTYVCRVSFIEDTTCYFEVETTSAPRFPVPEFTYEIKPSECLNRIYFTNKSHVMNKYYGYEMHTSELCDDQWWQFTRYSDGKATETTNEGPIYVAPAEGDTVHVRLRVFIGEANACDSIKDSIIIVPSIVDRDSVEYIERCEGDPILFNGMYYSAERDTTMEVTDINFAGCDSTYTLHVKVNPKTPRQYRTDSICSDSVLVIGDKAFNTTGTYTVFLQNQYGCDSVITTDLYVNQMIFAGVTTDMPMVTCADGENLVVDFRILAGEYDSIRLVYDSMAHVAGFRDMVTEEPYLTSVVIPYTEATLPGQYTAELEFHQFCCGVTSFTIPFEIQYRSSVVEQKWNDVLAVTGKKYNGGYEFISYQWYKNDKPISGATGSYLYEPLDTTAYYHVVLMRGDSVAVATCPITPTVHQDITKFPTLAKTSQSVKIHLRESAQIRIYTTSGQLYSDQSFGEGTATVIAPATTGAYIVDIKMLNGEHKSQYLIVGN